MAFHVEFAEPVLDYLGRGDGLADVHRASILHAVAEELATDADRFLVLFPLAHESLHFRYEYAYPTEHSLFSFDFVADASHMPAGVVRVVYVESASQPMP